MGATEECIEQKHEACFATWCDCGCHHDLIAAHHDGKHADAPNWRCHQCVKVARGDDDAVPSEQPRANPTQSKFWLGDHPRPCTCLNGPCDGGENGCGYDPAAWDAWEQKREGSAMTTSPTESLARLKGAIREYLLASHWAQDDPDDDRFRDPQTGTAGGLLWALRQQWMRDEGVDPEVTR